MMDRTDLIKGVACVSAVLALSRILGRATPCVFSAVIVLGFAFTSALAQDTTIERQPPAGGGAGWETDTQAPAGNTTVVPRSVAPAQGETPQALQSDVGEVRLSALLITDGPPIDRGLVWRIYEAGAAGGGAVEARRIATHRQPTPTVQLKPGDYVINAAFGRAHLTRKIKVRGGEKSSEEFVINAGGLRIKALVGEDPAPESSVTFDILEGEADQSGNRAKIMEHAKPGLIIRLNAGIYRILSRYGDANSIVDADITVEAGKLSEATISHSAAKVTFRLVDRPGGEALPGTRWTILTEAGEVVRKSVGALPTHILAPGSYVASAVSAGETYSQPFAVEHGNLYKVEVLRGR